jgi:hypothetical protein
MNVVVPELLLRGVPVTHSWATLIEVENKAVGEFIG